MYAIVAIGVLLIFGILGVFGGAIGWLLEKNEGEIISTR
jgi:hypothetical protein